MNCSSYEPVNTTRVGYAYVPVQTIGKVYTPEKAMVQGTVFPELDIPINEYERGLYDGK